MTVHTVEVKVQLDDFTGRSIVDEVEISIGYSCASATLSLPMTPFVGGQIYTYDAEKTLTWSANSDLVTINSF